MDNKISDNLDCYVKILDNMNIDQKLQKSLNDCIDSSFEDKSNAYDFDNKLLRED